MGLGGETTDRIIKESLTGVIFEQTSEKGKGGNSKDMVKEQQDRRDRWEEERLRGNPRPGHAGTVTVW